MSWKQEAEAAIKRMWVCLVDQSKEQKFKIKEGRSTLEFQSPNVESIFAGD